MSMHDAIRHRQINMMKDTQNVPLTTPSGVGQMSTLPPMIMTHVTSIPCCLSACSRCGSFESSVFWYQPSREEHFVFAGEGRCTVAIIGMRERAVSAPGGEVEVRREYLYRTRRSG